MHRVKFFKVFPIIPFQLISGHVVLFFTSWSMGMRDLFRLNLWVLVRFSSMPFDDSNIRKLVRYQLEKKIHFSRYKPLTMECKQLILSLLEPDIQNRATIFQIQTSDWINGRISSLNPSPINTNLTKIFYPIEDSTSRMVKTTLNDHYLNRKNSLD